MKINWRNSLYIALLILFSFIGIDEANDNILTANTHPKVIDQQLQSHVDYLLEHCEKLNVKDFCQEKINNVTRLEFRPESSWFLTRFHIHAIGNTYTSPLTGKQFVYISEKVKNEPTEQLTTLHELGHVLGLGHENIIDIMYENSTYDFTLLMNIDEYTDVMIKRAWEQSR